MIANQLLDFIKTDKRNISCLEQFGFRFGDKGTHTSRTMMLEEISILFQKVSPDAERSKYASEIIEHNCLAKSTSSSRSLTNQRIGEIYALDSSFPIFRTMRHLWKLDEKSRPLLALLIAICRDPLLRFTAPVIIRMRPGEELSRQQMIDIVRENVGGRLNDNTLDKVVRNTASSWTQSGHLFGRNRKIRKQVEPTPAVATFSLFLAFLTGVRGQALFEGFWAKLIDTTPDDLNRLAMDAKRMGLLDIKQSGGITVLSFDHYLSDLERKILHG